MIRRMEERDITPLAKLFLQGRRQTFHWVDPSLFHLDDFIEQTQGEEIWVAERGGTVCGLSPYGNPSTLCIICTLRATGMVRGLGERCSNMVWLIVLARHHSRWQPAIRRPWPSIIGLAGSMETRPGIARSLAPGASCLVSRQPHSRLSCMVSERENIDPGLHGRK